MFEIFGGMVDFGEFFCEVVEREFYEEIGYCVFFWEQIGVVEFNLVFFDNFCIMFLGMGFECLGDLLGDGDEEIEVVEVLLVEILQCIVLGEIVYVFVVVVFYFYSQCC